MDQLGVTLPIARAFTLMCVQVERYVWLRDIASSTLSTYIGSPHCKTHTHTHYDD